VRQLRHVGAEVRLGRGSSGEWGLEWVAEWVQSGGLGGGLSPGRGVMSIPARLQAWQGLP